MYKMTWSVPLTGHIRTYHNQKLHMYNQCLALVDWWGVGHEVKSGDNTVKFYHTSDGSSFTSVSTYLQKKCSGLLLSNPWCVRVRASQIGSNIPFWSHSDDIVSQDFMGIMSLPWKPVGLALSDRRQATHTGPNYEECYMGKWFSSHRI